MESSAPPDAVEGGRILVGRVGAPHGVRGEVRLQSFTHDPLAIARYGPLASARGRMLTLKSARLVKDAMLVVRIEGIDDRTAAQALTGLELFLERAQLPPPDEEEFYVADLVGMQAVDADGTVLGSVVGVPNYGGGDLVEIRPGEGGQTLLFAFTKAVVPTIDFTARRIVLIAPQEIEVPAIDVPEIEVTETDGERDPA